MNFEIASDKITGYPSSSGWAQVFDFNPQEHAGSPNLTNTHGRLIVVISMKGEGEPLLAKNILEELTRFYYSQKTSSPLEMLKTTLTKVVAQFSPQSQPLDLLVASFCQDTVFVVAKGNTSAFILRQGVLAQIVKGETKIASASGRLKEGDTFLFTTNNLFNITSPGVLKATLGNPKHTAFSESLTPRIHSESNLSDLASLVIRLKLGTQAPQINIERPVRFISPRRKIAGVMDKVIALLPERKLFVRSDEDLNPSRKKQVAVSVGIILLLLLGVSISFGIKQKDTKSARSKYEGKLIQAQHDFDEAQSLASLNPSRARELVLGAKTSADELVSQGVKDTRLTQLTSNIQNGLGGIAGIYEATPNLYLDLSLISSGFKPNDIAISEGRMAVLDRDGKKLVSIDEETKKTDVVAGPDIMPTALGLAVYSDRNFVVSDNGIWEVGEKANVVINKDWTGDLLVNAYTGNMYALEKAKNTVWRFAGDGGVFSTKQNWFGQGVNPDLSSVVSWAIDGSIWMLTKTGQILRFSQGSPQSFVLKDMDKPITNGVDLFTNEETNFVYLLDPTNGRVIVITKDGEFKAQYLSDELKKGTHIVVSEADKKIIFLEDTKLYSIDIKHL